MKIRKWDRKDLVRSMTRMKLRAGEIGEIKEKGIIIFSSNPHILWLLLAANMYDVWFGEK